MTWELTDVTDYAPLREHFDLVIVLYLHLTEGPRRLVLNRAAAAVAPGGTLLVVGHDSTNPELGWGGPQEPAVLYGPDEVAADLTGLDIVSAMRVGRPVTTDAGDRIAIDTVVRATRPPRSKP